MELDAWAKSACHLRIQQLNLQVLFCYRYWEEESKFVWYQDLETKGAHLISSFAIDEYVYLVVSSKLEEIKIFQVSCLSQSFQAQAF